MSADFTRVLKALGEANRKHAEEEWPGEGLNAVRRAVYLARGGHAPGERCRLEHRSAPLPDNPEFDVDMCICGEEWPHPGAESTEEEHDAS